METRFQEVARDRADANQGMVPKQVETLETVSTLSDGVTDDNVHKRKRSPDGIEQEAPTARMKLSITKWRRAKKSESRLKPSTEVIEINRVAVHLQDEWTISNLDAVCLWDERGIKAAAVATDKIRRQRRRHIKRCVAQVWRGRADETPKNLSLVTRGKLNNVDVGLVFDTAAQVTVISKHVWQLWGSPVLTTLRARASAADGASMNLLGALKLDISIGNKTFPYRVWVIDGLRSDVLLGLDFMDKYPTVIDTGRRLVAVQWEAIPIRMMDWDQSGARRQRRPVQV